MFVIVALGNPGEKYEHTRHNAGWYVAESFLADNGFPVPVESSKYAGRISEGMLSGQEVSVLFPSTYMNKSGSSVKKLVTDPAMAKQCIVVYDDVDLPIGTVRISVGRGSGGHNGVQSIIDALGTKEFIRIRLGIASKSFWTRKARRPAAGEPMTRHVLGSFRKQELKELAVAAKKTGAILTTIISEGVETAMNQYN